MVATPLYVVAGQSNALYITESGAFASAMGERGAGETSIVTAAFGRSIYPDPDYSDFYPFEDDDPATGELYQELVDGISAELAADSEVYLAGVFWLQGEEDAASGDAAADYYTNLHGLFENLVDLFGDGFDFVISALSTYIEGAELNVGWDLVRQAQFDLANSHEDVHLIDPDDLIDEAGYTEEQAFDDEFHYTTTGYAWLADAFFNLFPIGVNTEPVATDDAYAFDEDAEGAGADAEHGVLANDSDGDNDALTVSLVTDVTHGALVLNADGSFSYDPDADYHGTDSFTYEVSDGNGGTDTATVTLTVNPVNDDPVAVDDAAGTDWQTAVNIDVLSNDGDTEGDDLSVASVTDGANGTVAIELDGTVTYTPDAGFSGFDSFTYTLSDGNGGSDIATVEVSVGDPPPVFAEVRGGRGDDLLEGEDGVNDLIYGGRGNDRMYGYSGEDELRDGQGNDRMFAGDGDDLLIFKGGDLDKAWGGEGADTFVFGTAFLDRGGYSVARVLDYQAGIDILDLDRDAINSVREAGNKVILWAGSDNDKIVIKGVGDFDQLTFADDLIF